MTRRQYLSPQAGVSEKAYWYEQLVVGVGSLGRVESSVDGLESFGRVEISAAIEGEGRRSPRLTSVGAPLETAMYTRPPIGTADSIRNPSGEVNLPGRNAPAAPGACLRRASRKRFATPLRPKRASTKAPATRAIATALCGDRRNIAPNVMITIAVKETKARRHPLATLTVGAAWTFVAITWVGPGVRRMIVPVARAPAPTA